MTTAKARLARRLLLNRLMRPVARRMYQFLKGAFEGAPTPDPRKRIKRLQGQLNAQDRTVRAQAKEIKDLRHRAKGLRQRNADLGARTRRLRARLTQTQTALQDKRAEMAEIQGLGLIGSASHVVVDQLVAGASLDQAFVTMTRDCAATLGRIKIASLAFRFRQDPQTHLRGTLMLGVFMVKSKMLTAGLQYFRELDLAQVLAHAPAEYFDAWLAEDRKAACQALLAYAAERQEVLSAANAYPLVRVLIKYQLQDEARQLLRDVPALAHPPAETDRTTQRYIAWMHRRLGAAKDLPPVVAPDQINLAVMDYKMPDRDQSSRNRGDYVQTLAAIANICRFQDLRFAGGSDLAAYLEDRKGDIHPDRQITGPAATVVPVGFDRDYASGRRYHPNTWLICNGWFMHRNFQGAVDFPFPDTVIPLFISFHINDPGILSPTFADALRPYAPIGCRDWTTVYRLRDYGVPCFFSGCLTTSIGQVLPKADNLPAKKLAAVESIADPVRYKDWEVTAFTHPDDRMKDFSLVDGIEDSRQLLIDYLAYSRIQTARLHCYLPCRSMGFEVDFQPKNPADIRFEGLAPIDDAAFAKIRNGVETKLETVLRAIFAGGTKDEVLALWRDICAEDVAAAEAYCTAPLPSPPVADVRSALQTVACTGGPGPHAAIELAFALDDNLSAVFPAVLQSVVDHTPGPITVHMLYRGLDQSYRDRLIAAFPEIHFQMYDFGQVEYGADLRLFTHTTVATLDRLYLPELLPDVSKVLYLDIDILVRHDLRPVFETDLSGHVLAARPSVMANRRNASRILTQPSLQLPAEAARVMRRRLHQQVKITAPTFSAGVLLLNLDQMRADGFTAQNLYLATDCACNDQDVLNIYASGRGVPLDPRWNHNPINSYHQDPGIVHWAGAAKPWSAGVTLPWQADFTAALDRATQRLDAAAPQEQ